MAIRASLIVPVLLAAGATPLRPGLPRPAWIQGLPQQPGRVHAMGVAPLALGEAQALRQASLNARVEVLARLRATVQSRTEVQSSASVRKELGGSTSGASQQRVASDTSIRTRATDLPGLAVEETWLDEGGATAYALACLDVTIAERELRTRFEAARKAETREAPATGGQDRLRRLRDLKAARGEMERLDDMAALVAAAGGDPVLRTGVREAVLALGQALDRLRPSMTFSLAAEDPGAPEDVAGLLRTLVLREGLGWSGKDGDYRLRLKVAGDRSALDLAGKRWWQVQHTSPDFVVARGVLEVTLLDREGTSYQSTSIEAKGVGTTDFQAGQRLQKDFRLQLEKAFSGWLEDLAR